MKKKKLKIKLSNNFGYFNIHNFKIPKYLSIVTSIFGVHFNLAMQIEFYAMYANQIDEFWMHI